MGVSSPWVRIVSGGTKPQKPWGPVPIPPELFNNAPVPPEVQQLGRLRPNQFLASTPEAVGEPKLRSHIPLRWTREMFKQTRAMTRRPSPLLGAGVNKHRNILFVAGRAPPGPRGSVEPFAPEFPGLPYQKEAMFKLERSVFRVSLEGMAARMKTRAEQAVFLTSQQRR